MHECISAQPPAHRARSKNGRHDFFWMEGQSYWGVFLILLSWNWCLGLSAAVLYLCWNVRRVDLRGRCLGSGLEAEGCVLLWMKEWKDKKARSILWFFSGTMRWAERKPKGGNKLNTLFQPTLSQIPAFFYLLLSLYFPTLAPCEKTPSGASLTERSSIRPSYQSPPHNANPNSSQMITVISFYLPKSPSSQLCMDSWARQSAFLFRFYTLF